MGSPRSRLWRMRVARVAVLGAVADAGMVHSWGGFLFGWLSRVVAQVLFFGLVGVLLDDPERMAFVAVGSAVLVAAMEACLTTTSMQWERERGMLLLLAATPGPSLTALIGRGSLWLATGTISSVVALFGATAALGVPLPLPRALLAVPLIAVVAVTSFPLGCALGAVALRWPSTRHLIVNLATLVMLITGGALVPTAFWPQPVGWVSQLFPFTHGLAGVRAILASAPIAEVMLSLAAAALAGAVWLVIAVGALRGVLEHARRAGTSNLM